MKVRIVFYPAMISICFNFISEALFLELGVSIPAPSKALRGFEKNPCLVLDTDFICYRDNLVLVSGFVVGCYFAKIVAFFFVYNLLDRC